MIDHKDKADAMKQALAARKQKAGHHIVISLTPAEQAQHEQGETPEQEQQEESLLGLAPEVKDKEGEGKGVLSEDNATDMKPEDFGHHLSQATTKDASPTGLHARVMAHLDKLKHKK